MQGNNADSWVEAIAEEYDVLHWKGVFVKVEPLIESKIHDGCLVFMEKEGVEGETRRKVRIVAKGYTEVWGEDFWHTYSLTLGHDTLFSSLTYSVLRSIILTLSLPI